MPAVSTSNQTISLGWVYGIALIGLGGLFAVTLWETLTGNGPILWLIERYLSADQDVGLPLKRLTQLLMICGWLLLFVAFANRRYPVLNTLPQPRPWPVYFALGVLCVAFMVDRHGVFPLPHYLFEDEDMVLETLTWILFLVAMALLLLTARRAKAQGEPSGYSGGAVLIAVGLFVLAMEEISWGQRIIGWESPEYFLNHNDQQETNVHNFFNDYIWLAYQVFATLVSSVIVLCQTVGFRNWLQRLWAGVERLSPAPELLYFAPLFVLIANYNELFEEVFSVFSVLYALQLRRQHSPMD